MVEPISPAAPGRGRYRYQDVAARLRSQIVSGQLRVGDRLPPERELAQALGVSRTCVRQALQHLAQQHLVASRQGAGTYVTAPDPEAGARALAQAVAVDRELVGEIMEFRRLVEPQLAALAARRISAAQLDRLKVLVCDQDRRGLAGEADGELDAAFHRLLAEAAGNRLFLQVAAATVAAVAECRAGPLQSAARRRASVVGHLRIIDALEARDPERAAAAMRIHLEEVASLICRGGEAPPGER